MKRLVYVIAMLQALHVAAWSAYYSLTRKIYSGNEGFLLMLAAAETLPTAASLLGGFIAERYGYRVVFAIGILEGASLTLAGIWFYSPRLLWSAALLASLFWSIAGPQILGYTLTVSGLSSKSLGVVLAGGTIGWSAGGSIAPLAARVASSSIVLAASGAAVVTVYLALLAALPPLQPTVSEERLRGRAVELVHVTIFASLALTGTEIVGTLYLAKLGREFSDVIYALGIGLSGVIAAISRPHVGGLVDKAGANTVLRISLLAYTVYTLALMQSHGLAFLVLWLLPLYPFFDISLYRYAASVLGEAVGSSAVSASYSIAGAILLLLSTLNPGSLAYNFFAVTSFAAAFTIVAVRGENREHLYRGRARRCGGV